MANRLYNKQVTPKGYKKGGSVRDTRKTEQMIGASISSKREKGRAKKMFGGMMKRPMAEGGYITKKKTSKYITKKKPEGKLLPESGSKYITKKPQYITKKKQYITKKSPAEIQDRERVGRKMGGSLKPVDPKTQKGLSKLPTEVRNKMGYMKKGGKVHGK